MRNRSHQITLIKIDVSSILLIDHSKHSNAMFLSEQSAIIQRSLQIITFITFHYFLLRHCSSILYSLQHQITVCVTRIFRRPQLLRFRTADSILIIGIKSKDSGKFQAFRYKRQVLIQSNATFYFAFPNSAISGLSHLILRRSHAINNRPLTCRPFTRRRQRSIVSKGFPNIIRIALWRIAVNQPSAYTHFQYR